jgi:zinc transport system ATP-binding protein
MKLNQEDIILFNGVYKSFNNVQVLDNLNFSIAKGKITALIGPNGAGKSTIAKLILKALAPSRGEIIYDKTIKYGYVPQKVNLALNIPMSVKGFLDVMTCNTQNTKQYKEILAFANIESILEKQMSVISGGQLQRVLLSANLLKEPNFIILDEPTQGLDIETTNDFYLLLEQISSDFDITVFIISHDLHTVIKKADKVLCLNQHLCCFGSPQDTKELLPNSMSFYHHHHDHIHYL